MSFQNPEYAWICLLGLIPWLVYLFQALLGKKQLLPSLIFIEENKSHKKTPRKKILIYLLQSLALIMHGMLLASPRFGKTSDRRLCLVDDQIHTQWTVTKFEQMTARLSGVCSGSFYSLVSLSENRWETILKNRLWRNEPVWLQSVLLNWQ